MNSLIQPKDSLVGLVLTVNPIDAAWEFAAPPCACDTGLIGWVMREHCVEGGLPEDVAALIARVLSRCATVTMLGTLAESDVVSQSAQTDGATSSRVVKPPGIISSRLKKGYPLVTTRDPALVQGLICDGDFSWSLKSARLFLSAPAVLAELSYGHVDDAFARPDILNCDELLRNARVLGLILPAVDGDFAGIVAFSGAFWDLLISEFAAECRACQLTWSVVDEATFAATSWSAANR